jgi:hypothetical protein
MNQEAVFIVISCEDSFFCDLERKRTAEDVAEESPSILNFHAVPDIVDVFKKDAGIGLQQFTQP